jgi:two-component system, chemotaxis family, chemotaxis protein CheY
MKRALTPILVVDDDDAARAFITRALETLGLRDVDPARDGAEALPKLEAKRYGLIISDWHMNRMGGLQLLRHVRGHERFAHVPFMMITGDAQVDIVLTARQAGADAVVLKPFGIDVLRTKIGDVVAADHAAIGQAVVEFKRLPRAPRRSDDRLRLSREARRSARPRAESLIDRCHALPT